MQASFACHRVSFTDLHFAGFAQQSEAALESLAHLGDFLNYARGLATSVSPRRAHEILERAETAYAFCVGRRAAVRSCNLAGRPWETARRDFKAHPGFARFIFASFERDAAARDGESH